MDAMETRDRAGHEPFRSARLVITSVFAGTVYALDRDSGEIVWSYQASAGINAPLAVAGDTIIVPAGMPVRSGNNPRLIALRLPK